jgi:hypothetical protein
MHAAKKQKLTDRFGNLRYHHTPFRLGFRAKRRIFAGAGVLRRTGVLTLPIGLELGVSRLGNGAPVVDEEIAPGTVHRHQDSIGESRTQWGGFHFDSIGVTGAALDHLDGLSMSVRFAWQSLSGVNEILGIAELVGANDISGSIRQNVESKALPVGGVFSVAENDQFFTG